MFNVYGRKGTFKTNAQLTYTEERGMAWFLEKRSSKTPLVCTETNLRKYEDYYFGYGIGTPRGNWLRCEIPSHFGYVENETIAKTFRNRSLYIFISDCNIKTSSIFPESTGIPQYLEEDFKNLQMDPTVIKIYGNEGCEIWKT